jgi:hypothetical protein
MNLQCSRLSPSIFMPGAVLAMCLFAAAGAQAQSTSGDGNFSIAGKAVPTSGSGSTAPLSGGGQTCVQVHIQGQKPNPYDCLNQQLQSQVQGNNQSSPSLPLGANSPSNEVGTFNEQGLKEQYGQNFGKSVVPYRPPAPIFSSPVHP